MSLFKALKRWAWIMAACAVTLKAPAAEGSKKKVSVPTTVQFSPPGGVYTNDLRVRLASTLAGEVIRYTLNGTEPTQASPIFPAAFAISNSALIKVKGFKAGAASGPTVSPT